MIIELNRNPPLLLGQIKMQRSLLFTFIPRTRTPHTLRFTLVRATTLTITIVVILATLATETAHAHHSPNRRDRRPDREVRVRYPNTQPQSSNSRGPILHSAPATPAPSPPGSSDAEGTAIPGSD